VRVFNDNNATTPEATVAALNSIYDLYKSKPIIIIGGTDKNLPLETLEKTLQDKTKEIIYLSGTGTDRISLPKTWEYETLEACVKEAFSKAEKGDIILFSPAFASFSKYFNNEYEKSDEFVKQVKKYL
jgi:UDP-N-acetylmuramoylalanine--D-glutamate ligase